MIAILVLVLLLAVGVAVARRGQPDGLSVPALRSLARVSPGGRADWIRAMVAEYDSLPEGRGRRRFGRGCLWAALSVRGPVDGTSAWARAVILLSAASAIGLAVYGLVNYPGLTSGPAGTIYLLVFLLVVAVYAWAGMWMAGLGSSLARGVALVSALPAIVGAWWAASSNVVLSMGAVVILVIPPVLASWYVARKRQRSGDALVAAGGASLAAGFFTFIAYVVTIYMTNGGPATPTLRREFAHSGAHNYAAWAVSDDLAGAVFLLLFVPVVGVALGALAAVTAVRQS